MIETQNFNKEINNFIYIDGKNMAFDEKEGVKKVSYSRWGCLVEVGNY